MLPEHADRIRRAVDEFRNLAFPDLHSENSFFECWGVGVGSDRPRSPWESFEFYRDLLAMLYLASPEKYGRIHKGTPFFFLSLLSFDLKEYGRALFYLDAALAEDMRNNQGGWRKLPACKIMRLQIRAGTTADRIIPELRNCLDNHLRRFHEATDNSSGAPTSTDEFVERFVDSLLQPDNSERRHLVAGLYSWLFEQKGLFKQLVLRGCCRSSVLPVLFHLFQGGLIFESLLKILYPGSDQLGMIFRNHNFRRDFDIASVVQTHAESWADVGLGMPDHSVVGAFTVTGKLRNYLGHDLARTDVFSRPEQYRDYFEHEVSAILHVIAKKYHAAIGSQ